jgi:hypothetical protein
MFRNRFAEFPSMFFISMLRALPHCFPRNIQQIPLSRLSPEFNILTGVEICFSFSTSSTSKLQLKKIIVNVCTSCNSLDTRQNETMSSVEYHFVTFVLDAGFSEVSRLALIALKFQGSR